MPNIDGGHYFLTLLAPVKTGESILADGLLTTHSHLLREELANLLRAGGRPPRITLATMVAMKTARASAFVIPPQLRSAGSSSRLPATRSVSEACSSASGT